MSHRSSARRNTIRGQRGLSIIEIMVGLVIALLVSLAASGSAAVFSASQRQGVGVGGMSTNVGSVVAAMKSDIASGGLGFFGDSVFQCWRLDLSVGTTVRVNGSGFSPVRIFANGTSYDVLDVYSASSIDAGANVLLSGTSDGTSATVQSLLPAIVGDAVLLAPAAPGSNKCQVRTVTAVAPADENTKQVLTFGSAGLHNGATFGSATAYADKDRLALLGTLRGSRYAVSGTTLMLQRPLQTTNTSVTLLQNVMAFRAQYGVTATAGDTTLQPWADASGAWGSGGWYPELNANNDRIRAVRIGIVTRSTQREKENASTGVCEASTEMPTLFGTAVTADVTDWRCYRYRTTVVVVPLRNMVW